VLLPVLLRELEHGLLGPQELGLHRLEGRVGLHRRDRLGPRRVVGHGGELAVERLELAPARLGARQLEAELRDALGEPRDVVLDRHEVVLLHEALERALGGLEPPPLLAGLLRHVLHGVARVAHLHVEELLDVGLHDRVRDERAAAGSGKTQSTVTILLSFSGTALIPPGSSPRGGGGAPPPAPAISRQRGSSWSIARRARRSPCCG